MKVMIDGVAHVDEKDEQVLVGDDPYAWLIRAIRAIANCYMVDKPMQRAPDVSTGGDDG